MSRLDEVPFKIRLGLHEEVQKVLDPVTAPEIIVPDYLKILQETEYVFSLENMVLTGVQGSGCIVPNTTVSSVFPTLAATCPPYWMLFRRPQQSRPVSRQSSDVWEPNPLWRSRSLNATDFHAMNDKVWFNISDDDDDDDSLDNEKASCTKSKCNHFRSILRKQELDVKDLRPGCLPSCCGVALQQSFSILQCSLPNSDVLERNKQKIHNHEDSFPELSENQQLLALGHMTSITQSSGLNSGVPLAPTRPLGSHARARDSSVELLSALSPEEQQLLEAVTEQGYTLRTAIITLQKMGHRSPEQILSYLVACDHLCGLGYDETQVEEALEMFQNCETKAKEFLHLLTQFHEMGFQQNDIKEVLLMNGNHRDLALEELMMQVA